MVSSVTFLGLHIDRELRWKEQIAAAIGKGREWLRQCGRLAKMSGGVSGLLYEDRACDSNDMES